MANRTITTTEALTAFVRRLARLAENDRATFRHMVATTSAHDPADVTIWTDFDGPPSFAPADPLGRTAAR